MVRVPLKYLSHRSLRSHFFQRSFLGQVPFVATSVLITIHQMPSSLNKPKNSGDAQRPKAIRIDYVGIINFAITVLLLLFTIHNLELGSIRQSRTFYIIGSAFLSSTAVFLMVEIFLSKTPLIPLDLIKTSFGAYCASQLLITMGRTAVRKNFSSLYGVGYLTLHYTVYTHNGTIPYSDTRRE